mmetsp:Transcript_107389/g.190165  ORF Transcript_107389/g.190165 Transcript_107389/m.190165 type:complete len:212 (-) Transcript_107389:779-1414(-)
MLHVCQVIKKGHIIPVSVPYVSVPNVDKHLAYCQIVAPCCVEQGSLLPLINNICICSAFEQGPSLLFMTEMCCVKECSATLSILDVRVGLFPQKQGAYEAVCGSKQCSLSSQVFVVDLLWEHVLQESLHILMLARLASNVERHSSFVVEVLWLCSVFQEGFYTSGCTSARRRREESGLTLGVLAVQICLGHDEELRQSERAPRQGVEQRRS